MDTSQDVIALRVGDVIALSGRSVRVSGMPDGTTVCRDYRKRIAVRNTATNRLSYIPEWRLLKAKRATNRGSIVTRYDLVQTNVAYTTDHEMERSDDGEWVRYEDVEQLRDALKALHDDIADYARVNKLGGFDNHCMKQARSALAKASE